MSTSTTGESAAPAPRGTRPRTTITTRWGGGALVLAALLMLVTDVDLASTVPPALAVPLQGVARVLVVGVLELAAAVVLAVGVRGEPGVAGPSATGRAALVVFGAGDLVLTIGATTPIPQGGVGAGLPGEGLQVLVLVAAVLAAVAVGRAGVLRGPARWALPGVAVADVVGYALRFLPGATSAQLAWAAVVQPAALLLLGVLYAASGRGAARRGPAGVG